MKTRTKKSAFAALMVALALLAATLGGGTLLFAQTESGEPESPTVVADRNGKRARVQFLQSTTPKPAIRTFKT